MARDEDGRGGTLEMVSSADTVIAPARSSAARAAGLRPPERASGSERFAERYQDEGLLGEGGMGVVTLHRDRRLGRRVAVKTIRAELKDHEGTRGRFVREARVQGQLEHPAVVPVYDLGTNAEGAAYFTMKRVRGISLADILDGLADPAGERAERFSRRRLLQAFSSVCLAVDFAHRRGVVHRDLKPANIMLGDFGEVYLLDWGVARLADQDETDEDAIDAPLPPEGATVAGAMVGTPGYMAPEQLVGELQDQGPASDVYALGAILFEILTLRPLHPVESLRSLAANLVAGVEARPSVRWPESAVPPELDAICVRATAFVPADRYPSARELQRELERYLEGERDVELRGQLADEHAIRAAQLADRARSPGAAVEDRSEAMREIGRALALDPTNDRAMGALVGLLTNPPAHVPPAVEEEMARSGAEHNRDTARIGSYAYLSLLLYVPVLLVVGLRESGWLWPFCLLAAATSALSFWTTRARRPPDSAVLAVMILSTVMFASTWRLFGPLVLLPTMLATNTTAFAIHLTGRARWLAIAIGCGGVLVPFAVESMGLVSASYRLSEQGMLVAAQAMDLSGPLATAFLCVVSAAAIVTGSVAVSRVRDALSDAERRLYLHNWHLRALFPEAAAGRADE